jgi:hypothetical protein
MHETILGVTKNARTTKERMRGNEAVVLSNLLWYLFFVVCILGVRASAES